MLPCSSFLRDYKPLDLVANMFLSFNLFCQTLAVVTVVQASYSSFKSKDQPDLKDRFIRSRALNTSIAEDKVAVADSNTSSISSSNRTHSLQNVKLDLSTTPIVQGCDNGTGSPVIQDCSCSTQQLAAQAINDAITMVQAVKGVWNYQFYEPVLEQYMGSDGDGSSCQTSQAESWIDGEFLKQTAGCKHSPQKATLANLANIQEYRWLPSDPSWLSDYSGNLSVYCATSVPPPQTVFTADCQQEGSFGWAYTSDSDQVRPP